MPSFSNLSKKRLLTCDLRIQQVCNRAIMLIDFSVLCGFRGEKEQNEAFDKGFSSKRWPDGKHNRHPSEAVDLAPYPINWQDIERFVLLAGIIIGIGFEYGVPIRWGGDWNSNFATSDEMRLDYVHFELK